MKITSIAFDTIIKIENEILALSDTRFYFKKTFKQEHSFSKKIQFSYQFFDSIENYNFKNDSKEKCKLEIIKALKNNTCKKSILYDNFFIEVFEILKSYKVGFIEINKYEKGTNISFVIDEKKDFDIYNNIPVTLPGISTTILTINEDYYISNIKRGMNCLSNGKYIDTIKHKLIRIDYSSPQYEFYFEGIEEPIISFTRGHIKNNLQTSHRVDYLVIEKFLGGFIKNVIKKCGEEVCILESKDSIKMNTPILIALQEITNLQL